jgi:hypothetical protein
MPKANLKHTFGKNNIGNSQKQFGLCHKVFEHIQLNACHKIKQA